MPKSQEALLSAERSPSPMRRAAGGFLAGTALFLAGCNGDPQTQSPATCFSERAVAQNPDGSVKVYSGNPDAVHKDELLNWVQIETDMPGDRKVKLSVAHRNPDHAMWNNSKSSIESSSAYRVNLAILRGDVTFSARYEAPVGSVYCDQVPNSRFNGPTAFAELPRGGVKPEI